jgi:predicted transcriptional regulator
MESRDKEINLIAGRIMDEYRKYPSLEWNKIAASKIHSQWFEYFSKQTKELQQKVEQLQFELKAADSDYHYKTKALTDEIEVKNAKIKSLEDSLLDVTRKSCAKVDELQSRIIELEKGNIDCAHEKTVFRHIRCTACVDCGHLVEIDV